MYEKQRRTRRPRRESRQILRAAAIPAGDAKRRRPAKHLQKIDVPADVSKFGAIRRRRRRRVRVFVVVVVRETERVDGTDERSFVRRGDLGERRVWRERVGVGGGERRVRDVRRKNLGTARYPPPRARSGRRTSKYPRTSSATETRTEMGGGCASQRTFRVVHPTPYTHHPESEVYRDGRRVARRANARTPNATSKNPVKLRGLLFSRPHRRVRGSRGAQKVKCSPQAQ